MGFKNTGKLKSNDEIDAYVIFDADIINDQAFVFAVEDAVDS